MVTLGINNCFAVKRWPLADEWAEIVGAELELELVQHSLDLVGDTGSAIRAACDRRGLVVHSVFTGLIGYSRGLMLSPLAQERTQGQELWMDGVRLAAELGARSFGGHVGSLSRADAGDGERRQRRWQELEHRLANLRGRARAAGLDALLVENMACDREPSRMDECAGLLQPADERGAALELCLDVGHQCVPGTTGAEADPYAWLRRVGRHASVIHLQQSDAAGDHHWPFTAQYNALGRIEAPRLLEALAEGGADRAALILEVIPSFEADDGQVLAELRESVAYWKDAIDE